MALSIGSAGALEQLSPLHLLVTCDLLSASGYAGAFRVLLAASDMSGQESGTGTTVLASRTITVAP